jgi:hypothetical protein
MDTNTFNLWWLIMFVPLLIGCPFGDDKCPFNDWERIPTIEDMLDISSMKNSFRIGECFSPLEIKTR